MPVNLDLSKVLRRVMVVGAFGQNSTGEPISFTPGGSNNLNPETIGPVLGPHDERVGQLTGGNLFYEALSPVPPPDGSAPGSSREFAEAIARRLITDVDEVLRYLVGFQESVSEAVTAVNYAEDLPAGFPNICLLAALGEYKLPLPEDQTTNAVALRQTMADTVLRLGVTRQQSVTLAKIIEAHYATDSAQNARRAFQEIKAFLTGGQVPAIVGLLAYVQLRDTARHTWAEALRLCSQLSTQQRNDAWKTFRAQHRRWMWSLLSGRLDSRFRSLPYAGELIKQLEAAPVRQLDDQLSEDELNKYYPKAEKDFISNFGGKLNPATEQRLKDDYRVLFSLMMGDPLETTDHLAARIVALLKLVAPAGADWQQANNEAAKRARARHETVKSQIQTIRDEIRDTTKDLNPVLKQANQELHGVYKDATISADRVAVQLDFAAIAMILSAMNEQDPLRRIALLIPSNELQREAELPLQCQNDPGVVLVQREMDRLRTGEKGILEEGEREEKGRIRDQSNVGAGSLAGAPETDDADEAKVGREDQQQASAAAQPPLNQVPALPDAPPSPQPMLSGERNDQAPPTAPQSAVESSISKEKDPPPPEISKERRELQARLTEIFGMLEEAPGQDGAVSPVAPNAGTPSQTSKAAEYRCLVATTLGAAFKQADFLNDLRALAGEPSANNDPPRRIDRLRDLCASVIVGLFHEQVGIGRQGSGQVGYMLDLMLEGGDAGKLLRTQGVHKYFPMREYGDLGELEKKANAGVDELRRNLTPRLSDLYGLRTLFKSTSQVDGVEVVVFNDTAEQFLIAYKTKQFTPLTVTSPDNKIPLAIYFADSAFKSHADKVRFLKSSLPWNAVVGGDDGVPHPLPICLVGWGPDWETGQPLPADPPPQLPPYIHLVGPGLRYRGENDGSGAMPLIPSGFVLLAALLQGQRMDLGDVTVETTLPQATNREALHRVRFRFIHVDTVHQQIDPVVFAKQRFLGTDNDSLAHDIPAWLCALALASTADPDARAGYLSELAKPDPNTFGPVVVSGKERKVVDLANTLLRALTPHLTSQRRLRLQGQQLEFVSNVGNVLKDVAVPAGLQAYLPAVLSTLFPLAGGANP